MQEILWVLLSIILLGSISPLANMLPTAAMVELGFLGLTLGLLIGVPSGFWYHLGLYRALAAKTAVPKKWWLSPTNYHSHLASHELAKIRPWYLIGALGFTLALAGGLLAMGGLLYLKNN